MARGEFFFNMASDIGSAGMRIMRRVGRSWNRGESNMFSTRRQADFLSIGETAGSISCDVKEFQPPTTRQSVAYSHVLRPLREKLVAKYRRRF